MTRVAANNVVSVVVVVWVSHFHTASEQNIAAIARVVVVVASVTFTISDLSSSMKQKTTTSGDVLRECKCVCVCVCVCACAHMFSSLHA